MPLQPDSAPTVLRKMTLKTLDGMAHGGIYDQIAGGFARYSTDALWLVPHFEKMLYDNAQLAAVYAIAAVERSPDYARIARHTLDFLLHQMVSPPGAFYSAFDADSLRAMKANSIFGPSMKSARRSGIRMIRICSCSISGLPNRATSTGATSCTLPEAWASLPPNITPHPRPCRAHRSVVPEARRCPRLRRAAGVG